MKLWQRLPGRRVLGVAMAGGAIVACSALLSPPAGSATTSTTLRFFTKATISGHFHEGGAVVPETTAPIPGDFLIYQATDYLGTDKRHATISNGSSNVVCVFNADGTATCTVTISVGTSLLFCDAVPAAFPGGVLGALEVTGGTGQFKGEVGSVVPTSVKNSRNYDLVVTVHHPGELGITINPVTGKNGAFGVAVAQVLAGSAATKVGLVPGDIIFSIDGQGFSSIDAFLILLDNHTAGQTVALQYADSSGQAHSVSATLGRTTP